MLPPKLPIFADRFNLKAPRFEEPSAAEAIERMHLIGSTEQRLEPRQQQRHGEHVLLVVEEHGIQYAWITLAQPGEVAARDQAAGEVVRAMQVEHALFDGLQRTIGKARAKDPPRQRQQVEMGRGWPFRA